MTIVVSPLGRSLTAEGWPTRSRQITPYMYFCSSEAGGRGDLLRTDVDAAFPAERGVRRADSRRAQAPTSPPGCGKEHSQSSVSE